MDRHELERQGLLKPTEPPPLDSTPVPEPGTMPQPHQSDFRPAPDPETGMVISEAAGIASGKGVM